MSVNVNGLEMNMLPCPYCGRTTGFQVKPVWKTYRFVACQCKAAGPVAKTGDQAIELWNTRAAETCTFTLEYDRDEVERRRKAYEAEPFGLFPQEMPQAAWTCSRCGQQYKVNYRDTGSGPEAVPITRWMKHCGNCGARIAEAKTE